MRKRRTNAFGSETGLSLLELSSALVVMTVVVLSVGLTLVQGFKFNRESFQSFRALSAVRTALAQVQFTANQPLDVTTQRGIGSVYDKYHGLVLSMTDPPGSITFTCHADEASVPAELGGPQDLNFDGDAQDDLGGASQGLDLKLVPMTINVAYQDGNATRTIVLHRLMTMTEGVATDADQALFEGTSTNPDPVPTEWVDRTKGGDPDFNDPGEITSP